MLPKNLKPVDQNDEIHNEFKDTLYPPDVLDDFSRMQSALNAETITKHLKNLELELEKRLRDKNVLDEDKKIKKKATKKYSPQYHVLTEFMQEWGEKNGFNSSHTVTCIEKNSKGIQEHVKIQLPNTTPLIYDILTQDVFIKIFLHFAYLSKDVGAGVTHGEFTHFLQLYVIFEENKQNKFLKYEPLYLLKMAGDFLTNGKDTIWFWTFDQNSIVRNFTNPDFLNAQLSEDKNKFFPNSLPEIETSHFPVLVQMMKGRFEKREPSDHPLFPYTIFVNRDTQTKYREKNGLFVNDAIYFETADQYPRHVKFDDVHHELELYKKYFGKIETPLPKIPANASPLDQLLILFNAENYKVDFEIKFELEDIFTSANKDLRNIQLKLYQPGAILHHRNIANLLANIISNLATINEPAQPYARSAIAYTVNLLAKLEANLEAKPASNFKPRY